jgi:hypothetical protein
MVVGWRCWGRGEKEKGRRKEKRPKERMNYE